MNGDLIGVSGQETNGGGAIAASSKERSGLLWERLVEASFNGREGSLSHAHLFQLPVLAEAQRVASG